MLRKNVAGQFLYFALVNATTGAALTGASVTARRSIDGAAQATCTGTVSEPGNGQYQIALSQADTNGNNIGYLFTATNAIPVSISATLTAADPTDAASFGITRIDAAVTSRMATYTQPTGFLAATFPGTVASPTNITAATGVVLSTAGNEAAADALLDRTISGGANGGRDVTSALRFIRNRWNVSSGTLTVYAEDDTTSAWTAVVTGTPGADPITGTDPA